MNYPKGGPLSFVEENRRAWAKVASSREVLEERSRIQAEMEIMRRREAAEHRPGPYLRGVKKRADRILSSQRVFFEQAEEVRQAPAGTQEELLYLLAVYADDVLLEVGKATKAIDGWIDRERGFPGREEDRKEMERVGDQLEDIGDSIRNEMSKLSAWVSLRIEESRNRPSEKSTEEIPVPMTADEAMAEMKKQSKALDEAKQKAKKEVDYEKSTAKMAAIGSVGLGLFSALLIISSAAGALAGLPLTVSIVGTIFFALACVGALDKAKKVEDQWDSMIEVWEDDLAKATNEWLKAEGIYDFSNPEMP